MENKIAKRSVYDSLEKAEKMGQILSRSQIFGVKNPADAAVLAITCIVENITPLDFIRKYHIIQGRPTMRADAMLAEFCRNGGKHRIIEYSSDKCKIEFQWNGKKTEWEWTMEDAQRAGLRGDNWKKYPKDMLFARCVSSALKKICPELFHGLYVPEEIQDIEQEKEPEYAIKKEEKIALDDPAPSEYYTIAPFGGKSFKKGQKWEDIPRSTLWRLKDLFLNGALPIKLAREDRMLFSEEIEKAMAKRGDEAKKEEISSFEDQLNDLSIAELEKMARNKRYGTEKKKIILRKFMQSILKEELDKETSKSYKALLASFSPDEFFEDDNDLFMDAIHKLEGIPIVKKEEFDEIF